MTISEKLAKIAENTPKVYNAGYQAAVAHYEEEFSITGKLATYDKGIKGYPYKVTSTIELSESTHTSMVVGRYGKNLFDYTQYPFTNHYISWQSGNVTSSSGYSCTDFIPCSHLVGQTITLNHPPIETGGGNPGMSFYSETFNWLEESCPADIWLGDGGAENGSTAVVPDGAEYIRFSVPRAYADGTQIQIELGDTVTDYEPFNGKTVSNSWSEPVHGGTYDWDTGVLESSYACVKLVDLEWEFHADNGTYSAILPSNLIPDLTRKEEMSCTNTLILSSEDTFDDICNGGISYTSNIFNIDYVAATDTYQIAIYIDEAVNSQDDLQSVLTNMNPLLIYPLAEPKRFYLNPCQVAAIEGNNHLYCSIGNTTVSNRKNIEADMCEIFNAAIMRQSGE